LGLAIYVLVSAFIGHSQLGDLNQFQHFMKNMAIVGGSLAFVAFGGGAYSLDARSRKEKLTRSFPGREANLLAQIFIACAREVIKSITGDRNALLARAGEVIE